MRKMIFLVLIMRPMMAFSDFESASESYRNKDYDAAFEAFSEMAGQGDARSQTVLAIMYKYGESTNIDLEQAFHWYLEAAIQGYPPAQYNVGIMLADGMGVTKDTDAATEWLTRALDAGYDRAQEKLLALSGEAQMLTMKEEPVAWSQNWNLRLPNSIRFQEPAVMDSHEVYRIQLGAMSSIEGAERLWHQVLATSGPLFGGFEPIYLEAHAGATTVWRVQTGNFGSVSSATEFCSHYTADPRSKTGCMVVSE